MSEEFTPITTQEDLNKIIGSRVKELKASLSERDELIKERDKQIAEMTAAAEASAKKYKDIDKGLAERDAKIKAYEIGQLKNRIAHETGLKYEAVAFLQGEDEKSIKESAEALKKLTGSGTEVSGIRPSPAFKASEGEVDGVTAAFRKLNPNLKI